MDAATEMESNSCWTAEISCQTERDLLREEGDHTDETGCRTELEKRRPISDMSCQTESNGTRAEEKTKEPLVEADHLEGIKKRVETGEKEEVNQMAWLDYPFLTDRRSIQHLQGSQVYSLGSVIYLFLVAGVLNPDWHGSALN